MAVLVLLEGLAVGLLTVLVAGLLRSHAQVLAELAELQRRLGAETTAAAGGRSGAPIPVEAPARLAESKANDVVGVTPADETISIAVSGTRVSTLLAFLSSGCSTCAPLWQALAHDEVPALPDRVRLVVVTLGPGDESPARVRRLAPGAIPVVMSSDSWQDYSVPGAPYFVHVDGPSGRIVGEGSAHTWTEVRSLMGHAVADGAGGLRHRQREQQVDDELLRAGIRPGDARLHHPPTKHG